MVIHGKEQLQLNEEDIIWQLESCISTEKWVIQVKWVLYLYGIFTEDMLGKWTKQDVTY